MQSYPNRFVPGLIAQSYLIDLFKTFHGIMSHKLIKCQRERKNRSNQRMNTIASIEHQLLLAMPSLNDPLFFQAVVYICEYDPAGSMGIMINKPTDISLGEILRHLEIKVVDETVDNYKVVRGGPLGKDQGFIIQRKQNSSEIILSSSKQDLSSLAHGQGLDDTLVSLGYSAWDAGQLEQEIANNDWLVVPMDSKILFDVPFKLRWRQAAALIGVDFDKLSGDVGHA